MYSMSEVETLIRLLCIPTFGEKVPTFSYFFPTFVLKWFLLFSYFLKKGHLTACNTLKYQKQNFDKENVQ
jgi:hypothetical protein